MSETPTDYLVNSIAGRLRVAGVARIDVTDDDLHRAAAAIVDDLARPHRRVGLFAHLADALGAEAFVRAAVDAGVLVESSVCGCETGELCGWLLKAGEAS